MRNSTLVRKGLRNGNSPPYPRVIYIVQILVNFVLMLVVLPDPFRAMVTWRNSAKIQQSGNASRSEPEIKDRRSSAKYGGVPERLR